jgi:hypothetical protein
MAGGASFTGTGNIRQNYQNSNLNTYGLNVMTILQNKSLNTFFYYQMLGSGPQNNRIKSFNKRNGINIA